VDRRARDRSISLASGVLLAGSKPTMAGVHPCLVAMPDLLSTNCAQIQRYSRASARRFEFSHELREADEHVSKHCAVGHGREGVDVGSERAAQIRGPLGLAKRPLKEPTQPTGVPGSSGIVSPAGQPRRH
jgi:hypothetical protein